MQKSFKIVLLAFLIPLLQITNVCAQEINIGKTISIQSNILNEKRDIFISLPERYEGATVKYPVLYLLDGEGHFNYVSGLVKYLSAAYIPQMIVVGIPNTARNRDFTPKPIENIKGSGGADKFLQFMQEELIPYIDNNYRTYDYRILAGHSLCGMFAFYTLLQKPDLFKSYIAMSPWVIADNNFIVKLAAEKLKETDLKNKQIYFTAGSFEEKELLAQLDEMTSILKNNAPKGFEWKYKLMEGDDHATLVPPTVYDGLRFIYKDWRLTNETASAGLKSIMTHYEKLSEKYGYAIAPSELMLNNCGYLLIRQGNLKEAVEVMKKNAELFPRSANTYDSLGEAYELSGDLALAKENYGKAYQLGIDNNDPNTPIFKANFERAAAKINR